MDVQTVVIGAGVVGLAIARRLAQAGREVLLLDQADRIGAETSSRNSEVIHAGIYYPAGSLKARLCVAGKAALYAYCAERGVAAQATGKLIVAVDEDQIPAMRALMARGRANGVDDLVWLDADAAQALEPALRCRAALLSPGSGIVDSHALMLALLADAESAGAVLALHARVTAIAPAQGGYRLTAEDAGGTPAPLTCAEVVNSAGHGAPALAAATRGLPAAHVPRAWMAKGRYFNVSGATPFRHLIYPMPARDGLGIHITLDLAGRMRLGPDLVRVDRLDYGLDPALAEPFRAAVAPFWPGVEGRDLGPAYSGIRPRIGGPLDAPADFAVEGPASHGMAGLVNLFGIESPGLTSCLALADHAADQLFGVAS